jgi:hypothetical protein
MVEEAPERERRSPESLLARELVVVKQRADAYERELRESARLSMRKRARLRRLLEGAREREAQIIQTLGGRS